MYKIPQLYLDDPALPGVPCAVVQGGCHWVISDHGKATRKYDGLCVAYLPILQTRFRDGYGIQPMQAYHTHYQPGADYTGGLERRWFIRETYPLGVKAAPGFVQIDVDGQHVVGWRLASYTALEDLVTSVTEGGQFEAGTYELVGPDIHGNPHGFDTNRLIKHSDAEVLDDVPTQFGDLMHWLIDHDKHAGVVWHHQDGRMAQMERAAALRWQKAKG